MSLKRSLAGSAGLTLIEVVVAVGITSLAVGMIGAGLFRVHSIQGFWRDDVVATKELRRAGSILAGDALSAQNVLDSPPPTGTLLGCVPASPASTVTFILNDTAGVHTVTYSVTGEDLVRTYDGAPRTVARGVASASVGFSLCNNLLTFDLAVKSDRNSTESLNLQTQVRNLE